MDHDLKNKTINGLFWVSISQFGKQALQFTISIILARLLSPEDYGIFGIVFIFVSFATLFSELGFFSALIQKENVSDDHYSSVFWLNLAIGIFLALILTFCAPFIAIFFNESSITPILRLISINIIINSVMVVQNAIMNRKMDFKILAIIEIISVVFSGSIAIYMAFKGFGVWSLVWNMLILSTLSTILYWLINRWRPKFIFKLSLIIELFKYSSHLVGYKLLNYITEKSDQIIIGKFIGSEGLGLYNRAYSLSIYPLTQMQNVFFKVLFPAFSRIQNDTEKVKKYYLNMISILAFLNFPLMIILFVLSKEITILLLGHKWIDIVPILQIFCIYTMIQPILTSVNIIYQSQGHTDVLFKWKLFSGSFIIISMLLVVFLGGDLIEIIVTLTLLTYLALCYPNFKIAGRIINMDFIDIFKAIQKILVCNVLMLLSVLIVRLLTKDFFNQYIFISVIILTSMASYIAFAYIFRIEVFFEIMSIIRRKIVEIRNN